MRIAVVEFDDVGNRDTLEVISGVTPLDKPYLYAFNSNNIKVDNSVIAIEAVFTKDDWRGNLKLSKDQIGLLNILVAAYDVFQIILRVSENCYLEVTLSE